MKIVLAGAFGNLGFEILKVLTANGCEVVAADLKERPDNGLEGKYTFRAIDATNPETLKGLCDGAEVVITTFIISFYVDKVAHRFFYIFGLAAALTAWILVIGGTVTSIAGIWVFTILWGLNNGSSVQVFYALWGSELFPAKFRAGAQGLMFFIVRGLSAVWGLVFTFIYGENGEGFTLAAYCMVALLVISLVVGLIGMPNTRGRSLNDITKERYGENY